MTAGCRVMRLLKTWRKLWQAASDGFRNRTSLVDARPGRRALRAAMRSGRRAVWMIDSFGSGYRCGVHERDPN